MSKFFDELIRFIGMGTTFNVSTIKLGRGLLKGVLFLDFLITFGFGLLSWWSPESTFGTLISIEPSSKDLVLSLLSSQSFFYVLIGLVCFVGYRSAYPHNVWIAIVMVLRHGYLGLQGFLSLDTQKDWIIGSLTPDIVVHTLFVLFYCLGACVVIRESQLNPQ